MAETKTNPLRSMCSVCGKAPGQPCWPNGNNHPDRCLAPLPGPRVQVLDKEGWKVLYDSSINTDQTPDEFLAAAAASGVQFTVRVKGRTIWSGDVTMERTLINEQEPHDRPVTAHPEA